ncbi:glycosyltransferase family 4 protein [Pseudarthrobacter sp. YS3]|uniref:glycosyltransferase family 4 protein n=1 Tax=Pseudarthrobacter sp. YS3 TaxID=3453718 RepID=UPI003EE8D11A
MTIDLLFDGRHIRASGIGIYSREQIRHLGSWAKDNGVRAAVLGAPDELGQTVRQLEVVSTGSKRAPMYSLREQLIVAKILRQTRPRAFWTPHYPYPALSLHTRTFVTVHDVLHALPRTEGGHGGAKGAYAKSMLRTSLDRSAGVFVPSESTKVEVQRLFGVSSNLHVAPMRIGSAWLQAEGAVLSPRRRPGKDYLLFVGNVKKHKNLVGLLDAFAMIQDKINVDLVLAGGAANVKNQDKEVFRRLRTLQGRVHLMGNLSFQELRNAVGGAVCLVMPSLYEGVGLPPLEAMSVGTPVLASDIASLRETCGHAAQYFDPTEASSIAESILKVIQTPGLRESLSAKGRLHVRMRESSIDPLLPLKIISERFL